MIAIDTNILVRLVTRDDDAQAKRAAALFEREAIYVGKTVLLETEWVLHFSYELSRPVILIHTRFKPADSVYHRQ